ncbi:MAG: zinc-binding dehydrogenase [Chloroflexi bacterium]|nr:zinc-binding dehydrogenase [Chloroflexota bacterium]
MTGTMLAMQAAARADVRLIEIPIPTPADGQALVKMELASICGSDLHIVDYGWLVEEYPLRPGYPGHEGIGTIVDANGTDLREGDRVLVTPAIWDSLCFAEYQALGTNFLTILPADSSRTPEHLLMAQQLGTVIFAAKRLPNLLGQTCVVMGQGSAGLFWNYVLKHLGAERVVAIEPIAHRLEVGAGFGSDERIGDTFSAATRAVLALTGEGADVVVEAIGTKETHAQALELVRPDGQIVWFGVPQSAAPIPFDFDTFFRKRIAAYSPLGAQDELELSSFRQALKWIEDGMIDMSEVVTHSFPLSHIDEAFKAAREREDGLVKIVVTMG